LVKYILWNMHENNSAGNSDSNGSQLAEVDQLAATAAVPVNNLLVDAGGEGGTSEAVPAPAPPPYTASVEAPADEPGRPGKPSASSPTLGFDSPMVVTGATLAVGMLGMGTWLRRRRRGWGAVTGAGIVVAAAAAVAPTAWQYFASTITRSQQGTSTDGAGAAVVSSTSSDSSSTSAATTTARTSTDTSHPSSSLPTNNAATGTANTTATIGDMPDPDFDDEQVEDVGEEADIIWGVLKSFSILSVRSRSGSIHRLVQQAVMDTHELDASDGAIARCLWALARLWKFRQESPDTWLEAGKLIEHIKAATKHALQRGVRPRLCA
jgi:hypothetical protein